VNRVQFPVPWEDLFDSPNGIEWQYPPERASYMDTLNSTQVFYQVAEPYNLFKMNEDIKDYDNVILVSCAFFPVPRILQVDLYPTARRSLGRLGMAQR
jgi:hypothetical protein